MTKRRRILEWEKDFIYLVFFDMSIKDIGKYLNMSKSTVNNYTLKMKLHKPKGCEKLKIGDKFNKLTIIAILRNTRNKIKSKCECGNITYNSPDEIKVRKSCGCDVSGRAGKANWAWNGYEEIPGSMVWTMKRGAKKRKLEVTIDIKYLWHIFLNQNGQCALTGQKLIFGTKGKDRTASIDRIDSDKGYIEGNVQWVHKDINTMKWDFTQDSFINMCRLVANNFKTKQNYTYDYFNGI